jgi:hypothetical protein
VYSISKLVFSCCPKVSVVIGGRDSDKSWMGWRSVVHPIFSVVTAASVGTVGSAVTALLYPFVSGVGFTLLVMTITCLGLSPLPSLCALPVTPVPWVLGVALPPDCDDCFPFVFAYFHTCTLS